MPQKVSIPEESEIIQIISYDTVTAEDLKESLSEVLKIKKDFGYTQVLVDATQDKSIPSIADLHEFAINLSESAADMEFAIVIADKMFDSMNFFEKVVTCRFGEIKIFVSTEDAMTWLIK